jgi:hypothetical protein
VRLILSLILLALTVWALIDAARRRVEVHWFFLVVLGFPIGGLIYFAWAKLGLGDARRKALDRADRLEEQGQYAEAERIYRDQLSAAPNEPRALHGAARCYLELKQIERALEHFDGLMRVDPRYRDYSAALEYAEALTQAGRASDACDMLRGLALEAPRGNHRLALAHYLIQNNQQLEARGVLDELLASPDVTWHARARELHAATGAPVATHTADEAPEGSTNLH